jgi:hypothetical protein
MAGERVLSQRIVVTLTQEEAERAAMALKAADLERGVQQKLRAAVANQTCGCEATMAEQHAPDCHLGPRCGPGRGRCIFLKNTPDMHSDEGRAVICPGCPDCGEGPSDAKG